MTKQKDTATPSTPPKTRQVPRPLWSLMRTALRAVARDTRRKDRQLTDETRDLVENAENELNTWQDAH